MEISKIKPTAYVYNKKQMIGKGSFGEVYMGYNEKDHSPVAVKIVSFQKISAVMNKETLMTKLKQQITNMQIAKNQNLVQLLDAQMSSRNLYIICEYCNGESFDHFLERKGYLTEKQALAFFKQILHGFQNLHTKKIVHRDLKPANLLMHNYSIKIADLGFSKAIDQHEQLLESIVGTPLYMSPQIFSREKYTQKTDIWSLGVILFEMLYGRIPWKAKSLMQLKQKVENQPVQFPQSPIITSQTKKLIQSMLQLEESKRVSWQQLFSNYISTLNMQSIFTNGSSHASEMIEQKNEESSEKINKLFQYIESSFYIQSQYQLIKILIDLGIRSKEDIKNDTSFKNAEDFFNFKLFVDQRKLQILSYCFYFFGRRNRISYLYKIFECMYQITSKMSQKEIELYPNLLGLLISSQLLIIKFSIDSVHKMLNRVIEREEQRKIAQIVESGSSCYPKYLNLLLENDFLSFRQFFNIFYSQHFEKNMKILQKIKPALYDQINKQLKGLYNNDIDDYKFVKFMLGNSLRSIFNEFKNIQPKSESVLMLTRMIYEFQKDKQLFYLADLLESYKEKNEKILVLNSHDLHKKINDWKNDTKWKDKVLESSEMKIQSLSTFITKQFKWNPLQVYAIDFLK